MQEFKAPGTGTAIPLRSSQPKVNNDNNHNNNNNSNYSSNNNIIINKTNTDNMNGHLSRRSLRRDAGGEGAARAQQTGSGFPAAAVSAFNLQGARLTYDHPHTKILEFRGLDSSRILISRRGIPISIGIFTEVLPKTFSRDNLSREIGRTHKLIGAGPS